MKYFHNPETNEVHAYDDDAPEHFIPSSLLPMSETQIQAYIASATSALPTKEDMERNWRDSELTSLKWLRERHRDQLEIQASTSIDREQFNELLVYMQALRDWPQSASFPDANFRPEAPSWLARQIQ
ncbi:phage tail assembly chaperone [Pseudomonas sp. Au-Pse12]|uniref:phage tail assembly chaperone n=1 Tax=Pseudomonas sp. Au-Pse12 TaxID=2906459 RepID=UPI001E4EFC17|nr:phage tail assembly chaperone [Pseudomonas sp. Au-Pse12]MCE4053466.1 phage tail assembly chaperone [Pseudomonas sp. Au-Pse12]